MDDKFQKLNKLGAGDFDHIDGNLVDHLKGTRRLLASWGASSTLQDAGLYHAAYGTAGFTENLVSPQQRDAIANIIGSEAEEIVYLYCACDRHYFWPQIGVKKVPEFRNRFTDQIFVLSEMQLCSFCELTVANELEIAERSPSFLKEHGDALYSAFKNMDVYITQRASTHVETLLAGNNA